MTRDADDADTHNLRPAARNVLWLLSLSSLVLAIAVSRGAFSPPDGLTPSSFGLMFFVVTMALMWVSEIAPVAATSLLPFVILPILLVDKSSKVADGYSDSVIMLLMGGFFLAKGLERFQVPQVIAVVVERWARGSAMRLYYGLLFVTGFMSLWLSNTATTLVMITVGLASVRSAERVASNSKVDVERFRIATTLGIAYASNIGGIGTPVGTAPNAIMMAMYNEALSTTTGAGHVFDGVPLTFGSWMVISMPIVLILLPVIAVLLQKWLSPFPSTIRLSVDAPSTTALALSTGGRRASAVFAMIAVLWVFRREMSLGFVVVPGWSDVLGLGPWLDDGTVAIFGALCMMILPSGEGKGPILDWRSATEIPWSLILLFGGGLALADAFTTTGLSAWIGERLMFLNGAPLFVTTFVICLVISLLTEVTSNTATATLVLPVMLSLSVSMGLPPFALMWPTAVCVSLAFVLPISTPPNAIAAAAGQIPLKKMARIGIWLNMIAVVIITVIATYWADPLMMRATQSATSSAQSQGPSSTRSIAVPQ